MKGSVKQVSWAEDIRKSMIEDIRDAKEIAQYWCDHSAEMPRGADRDMMDEILDEMFRRFVTMLHHDRVNCVTDEGEDLLGQVGKWSRLEGADLLAARMAVIAAVEDKLNTEDSAVWYIDNRRYTPREKYTVMNGRVVCR